MKRGLILFAVVAFALPVLSGPVDPQDDLRADRQNDLGIGVVIGSVAGITAKKWTTEFEAFDFGIGSNYAAANSWLYCDYLWHMAELVPAKNVLPYIGVGGGVGFKRKLGNQPGDTDLFARLPIGLTWQPARMPLGVFAEIIPSAAVIPAFFGYLDAGVGARYFF